MSDRPPPLAELERACTEFNREYPVGSDVTYTPVLGKPETVQATIRTPATVLRGHTVIVHLTGINGAVSTRNISPQLL